MEKGLIMQWLARAGDILQTTQQHMFNHFYVFSGAIQFGAYMLIPFWFA